jgi:hypothetical protein
MTMVVASVVYFFLSDFPEDSTFLSAEEYQFLVARIYHDLETTFQQNHSEKNLENLV